MRVASCLLMCVVFASYVHAKLSVDRFMELRTLGLTGRIVNGTKAFSTQFPHQVSLKRTTSERHFCGGNIISDRLILTAAHCMYLRSTIIEPWTILVVAGELKLNEKTRDGQRRGVKNIIIHPKFNTLTYENDVAILELSIPLAFTANVRSTCLLTSAPKPQTKCLVSGWGYTASDIPIESVDLMYVELPIREPQECRELLVNVTEMYPGMLCAGYLEGGKDACQGDSGGGMVCDSILTGIVSAGEGCAVPLLPGVYSNVFYYKDWVQSYIEAKGSLARTDCGPNSCAHIMPSIMIICLFSVLAIMIGP